MTYSLLFFALFLAVFLGLALLWLRGKQMAPMHGKAPQGTESARLGGSDSKKTLYCSFCGKSQHEVRKLIAGPTVFICDECVELCMDIVHEEYKTLLVMSGDAVPTPTKILKVLDKYLDGQDRVKEVFSVVLHRHYRCFTDASKQASIASSPSNILLCGPSMVRSEFARLLLRLLKPFVAIDTTGLIGIQEAREVSQSIIRSLLYAADYNMERAQHGFVYMDDFDQLGPLAGKVPGDPNKVGEDVQKALISLMKGAVVDVPTSAGTILSVDTKSITFICAGTYLGLWKSTTGEAWIPAHGEDANEPEPNQHERLLRLSDAQAEALLDFGMLPDLVSCLSGVVALEASEQPD